MNKYILFLIAFALVCLPAVAIDVTECGILDQDGATYNLINDISNINGTDCILMNADNITLEGNNHIIQLSGNSYGVSFNGLSRQMINETIRNINILGDYNSTQLGFELEYGATNSHFTNIYISETQWGFNVDGELINNVFINMTSNNNSICGFYFYLSSNNTFLNMTSNNNTYGLYLNFAASNNTFTNLISNNNIYGFYLHDAVNNTLTNITSNNNTYGFYLHDAPNNIFYNIDFSTHIKVGFKWETDFFEMNNNNIYLKTNISAGIHDFDRKIVFWTKDNLTWNDNNATGGITVYYNLSALYVNRNYTVYNNSIAVSTLKTNGAGILPQFSIDLSNPITEIKVLAEAEPAPTKKKKHRAIIIT